MKKIIISIGTLAIVGVVVAGATGAWFTNTETSTGNTFTAGVIDLRIDNESYVTNNDGVLEYSKSTSWGIKDLDKGNLFFNFKDLKPGDVGEDTISLHVGSNDAWACMDINVTATPENGQTEPESLVDLTDGADEGELQDELEFVFWKDDGDNVLEDDEISGIFWNKNLQDISDGGTLALADSQGGVLENGTPLQGEEIYYIGKAWCQGTLTLTPLDQDLVGYNPDVQAPIVRGTGISCDGSTIGDASQTDGVVADVSFSVEQSRHNDRFLCNPPQQGWLTVEKIIVGGTITNPDDFNLTVDGDPILSGDTITVSAGTHTVSEDQESDYAVSYSAECPSGIVDVPANDSITCTITNTYTLGTLTVTKVVNGGPEDGNPGAFNLYVDGNPVTSGATNVMSPGTYPVTETPVAGYTASFSDDCDANGNVTVTANSGALCTITNTYTLATLTVYKVVDTRGMGTAVVGDFALDVSGEPVVSGVEESFSANVQLAVTETEDPRYTLSYSGDCDENGNITLSVGQNASCTITNTYNRATLTVDKWVMFSDVNTGIVVGDFTLHVTGPGFDSDVIDEIAETDLQAGTYTVTETYTGDPNATPTYTAEYGIDCNDDDNDNDGEVTLAAGDDKTCRIINLIED